MEDDSLADESGQTPGVIFAPVPKIPPPIKKKRKASVKAKASKKQSAKTKQRRPKSKTKLKTIEMIVEPVQSAGPVTETTIDETATRIEGFTGLVVEAAAVEPVTEPEAIAKPAEEAELPESAGLGTPTGSLIPKEAAKPAIGPEISTETGTTEPITIPATPTETITEETTVEPIMSSESLVKRIEKEEVFKPVVEETIIGPVVKEKAAEPIIQVPDNRLPAMPDLSEEDNLVRNLAKLDEENRELETSLEPVTLTESVDHSISFFKSSELPKTPIISKSLIRGLIIALLVLAVIAVGALAWVRLKPENLQSSLDSAVANIFTSEKIRADIDYSVPGRWKLDDTFISIDNTTSILQASMELTIDGDITQTGSDITLNIRVIATVDTWYIKVEGISEFINQFPGATDALMTGTLSPALSYFGSIRPEQWEQWISVDQSSFVNLLAMVPGGVYEGVALPKISPAGLLAGQTRQAIATAYLKYPIMTAGETIGDVTPIGAISVREVSFSMDSGKAGNFASALNDLEIGQFSGLYLAPLIDRMVGFTGPSSAWLSATGSKLLKLEYQTDDSPVTISISYGNEAKTDVMTPEDTAPLDLSIWGDLIIALFDNTTGNVPQLDANIEMQNDMDDLYRALEIYFAQEGYYPLPTQLTNLAWVEVNLEPIDMEVLIDPNGVEMSADSSLYYYLPFGCVSGGCRSYILGATLSDGSSYEKLSDNG